MNPRPFVPASSAVLSALALLLTGCAATRNYDMPAAGSHAPAAGAPTAAALPQAAAQPQANAPQANAPQARVALVTPTGQPAGNATLRELPGGAGVEIAIEVRDMAPGAHGFHIHANGACAPGPDAASGQIIAFGAAGGHFDPYQTRNHGRPGQSAHEAHAGEAPNITVGADRRGSLRFTNPQVTLQPGKTTILGRTLIVHEREDDYASDPACNSGGRIACGIIEPAAPGMVQGRALFEGANVFPEGIAVDSRSGTAYVGSSSEGHIYRIAAGADKAEMLQMGGSPGRQAAFGMKVDAAGRLWVAGGPGNTVAVVDPQRATTLAVVQGPKQGQGFLNDLVLTSSHAYVTDSFRPVLWRIATAHGAPMLLEPWLDLRDTPVRYVPNQINFNGIVASPDGRWLLAIQLATGQLWRIDTGSRAVSEVRVEGGSLVNGDGLVLDGTNRLYVVRNADNELVQLALADGWGSARVEQRLHDARLKYPTTAAKAGNALLVVNGQLNKQKDPPPFLPFDVLRVGLPR